MWNVVHEERKHASESLRLQAQTFALLLDRHIADTESLLGGIAASAIMWDGNPGQLADALQAVEIPAGDIIAVASADGAVLLNTMPAKPGHALAPIPPGHLLDLVRSHKSGVTNLYLGPQTGSLRLGIVQPMTLPSMPAGTSNAMIYSMQASKLVDYLFEGDFPSGLAIDVIDRKGVVVAGSQRLRRRVGQFVDPALLAETAKADSGLFQLPDATAGPSVIAFAHSRSTGFTVMAKASNRAIHSSELGGLRWILIMTGLFCLPGLVLIFAATRRLTAGLGLLAGIASGKVSGLRLSAVREIDAAARTLVAAKAAEAVARERLRLLNVSLESRIDQAVAELERARERTMHASRLETLGALASGMAHDFGNVLQVVDGCASLIRENLDERLAVERWAVMLEAEVNRGTAVVQRLMSYSRKDALKAAEIDVALLLAGVGEILRHTLPRRIVVVVVDTPTDLPPIWADKAQLETVLVNLGTNARDAMVDGGTFTLSATLIATTCEDAVTSYIQIDATDTGTGMPAHILARATEPFFTTKEVGKGTGLGLAMARDFAESSGGRMEIASEPGLGTTVSLFVPLVLRAEVPPVDDGACTTSATPGVGTTQRVLLIEDIAGVREVIARNLRKAGFAVDVEAEGQSALTRVAAGEALDIVITDYCLGGIKGNEVISALHELRPGLPIIMLTGDPQEAEVFLNQYEFRRYMRVIGKPASGLDLAEAIHLLLCECGAVGPLPVETVVS
jgi:signal transduction histidine kinase/CheY-like chemotaxis protein